jgi:hypothetical protein
MKSMMNTVTMYTYETLATSATTPGQTIIRREPEGFEYAGRRAVASARELIAELDLNGDGVVVLADDSDPNQFMLVMEGRVCGNLHQGAWEPYFRQEKRDAMGY